MNNLFNNILKTNNYYISNFLKIKKKNIYSLSKNLL